MTTSEYDFIIVGGGTAGLVLASRLSENPHYQVLVIEAGQDQTKDPRVTTPALWPTMLGTESDWSLKTIKQVQNSQASSSRLQANQMLKAGFNDRAVIIPQGRLLGGSSALNGLAFTPNSQISTDAWAELGNPGWDWSYMSKYFKKSHTINKPSDPAVEHLGLDYIDENVSGKEGPIQLSFPEDTNDVWPKAWIETLTGLGYPISGDPFSGQSYGGYINAESIDPLKRQRSHAANAYLEPVRSRSNLTIATGSTVQKVILEKTNDEHIVAKGVQFLQDGAIRIANARKDVILSGGTYSSPKILELSGVGDSRRLQRLGIPVMIDNANVGENLQNHPLVGLSVEVVGGVKTLDPIARQDPTAIAAAMEAYSKQSGPFSNSGTYASALLPVFDFLIPEGKAELKKLLESSTASSPPKDAFSDFHERFVRSVLDSPREGSGTFLTFPGHMGFNPDGSLATPIKGTENYFTIAVLLSYPLSRGSAHIASSDPSAKPVIDPHYLSHPLDLEILSRHLRFAESTICNTEPLRSLIKPGGLRSAGVPPNFQNLDDVKDFIKKKAVGAHHPTGTCSMMPEEIGGVVSSRLKVYGVKGLRVCDASIIPISPRSNPQATVYAVAERAADLIKEDWVTQVV